MPENQTYYRNSVFNVPEANKHLKAAERKLCIASRVGRKSARSENGVTYSIYSAGISDEQKHSIVDQIKVPVSASYPLQNPPCPSILVGLWAGCRNYCGGVPDCLWHIRLSTKTTLKGEFKSSR